MPKHRVQMSFVSEDEVTQIEETAYRLLAEVGVVLEHPEAVEMLHGLRCRPEKGRVFIPRDAIQWAIRNVTPHREFFCRDGSPAFATGDGELRFHNAGGLPFMYDLETGERRQPTLKDLADCTRILDALPNVDVVIPLFGPQDVAPELMAVASTDVMLRNTSKSFSAAAIELPQDVPYVVEMAAACCGGREAYRRRPNMYISVSPVSPLKFSYDVAATIIAVARSGTPFNTLPAPSLGATGPISLAGALAQQHAEVLASFLIAAAAAPGAPVTYCSRINPIDLRTAVSSWGGPEIGMGGAIAAQLAHRIGLTCDSFGLCTSATRLDPQFAYERLANALVPALGGCDILSGVASTESVLAGAPDIAVLDDEIIGLIKHVAAGCAVNEETLAFDVMQEVIPRDGVFLGEPHTVQQVRKGSIWLPRLSGRAGGQGVVKSAQARARELLARHEPAPLAEDVVRQLDEIMERAARELPVHARARR
ncbi:MAG TPA: trimethylamine methyltransferase family protein [Anaerolineae bacterium]